MLVASVFLNAAGLHLVDAGLRHTTPITMLVLTLVLATLGFFLLGGLWRAMGLTRWSLDSVTPLRVLAAGRDLGWRAVVPPGAAAVAGWLATTCVKLYGPETTAFLFNQTLVFLVLAGYFFLRERPSRGEWPAIVTVVVGAFVYSYRGGGVQWGALALMTAACLGTAIKQVSVKLFSTRHPLPVVMVIVVFVALLWSAGFAVVSGGWERPPALVVAYAAGSVLCTNIVGMTLLYSGYHAVGVSRGAPINAMRPLGVLLIGLALGHAWPTRLQAVGGILILGGSAALALLHQHAGRSGTRPGQPAATTTHAN